MDKEYHQRLLCAVSKLKRDISDTLHGISVDPLMQEDVSALNQSIKAKVDELVDAVLAEFPDNPSLALQLEDIRETTYMKVADIFENEAGLIAFISSQEE
jgi:hypothetical protein